MSFISFLKSGVHFEHSQYVANFYLIDTEKQEIKEAVSKVWEKLYSKSIQATDANMAIASGAAAFAFTASSTASVILGLTVAVTAVALAIFCAIRAKNASTEFGLWTESPTTARAQLRQLAIFIEEKVKAKEQIDVRIRLQMEPDKLGFIENFFSFNAPKNLIATVVSHEPTYTRLEQHYNRIVATYVPIILDNPDQADELVKERTEKIIAMYPHVVSLLRASEVIVHNAKKPFTPVPLQKNRGEDIY